MFFSGCLLNIARNAIVNCSELVTYDIIKEQILKNKLMTGRVSPHPHLFIPLLSLWSLANHSLRFFPDPADNMPCHFTAAFAAGFCTTVVASPVDVVKTRFMNSVPGQYGGAANCALTMLLKEGPLAFYKGWVSSLKTGADPVQQRIYLSLSLQLHAVVSSPGVLEHSDVCQLRADSEGRGKISVASRFRTV